jgi:hypothetical protein
MRCHHLSLEADRGSSLARRWKKGKKREECNLYGSRARKGQVVTLRNSWLQGTQPGRAKCHQGVSERKEAMTEPYWTEIARHPQGHVLYARFREAARLPWLKIKLMLSPRPIAKRLGERRRIPLLWNVDEQRLSEAASPLDNLPDLHNWVLDVLDDVENSAESGASRERSC